MSSPDSAIYRVLLPFIPDWRWLVRFGLAIYWEVCFGQHSSPVAALRCHVYRRSYDNHRLPGIFLYIGGLSALALGCI